MPRDTHCMEALLTAQAHIAFSRKILQLLNECLALIPEITDNHGVNHKKDTLEILLRDALLKTELYQRWAASTFAAPHNQAASFHGEDGTQGNSNWDYVDAIMEPHRPGMTWKRIYAQGKKEGYFSTFPNHASLRSTYHQYKRQQQHEQQQ